MGRFSDPGLVFHQQDRLAALRRDSIGPMVQIADQSIAPSFEVCGVYRLPAEAPVDERQMAEILLAPLVLHERPNRLDGLMSGCEAAKAAHLHVDPGDFEGSI